MDSDKENYTVNFLKDGRYGSRTSVLEKNSIFLILPGEVHGKYNTTRVRPVLVNQNGAGRLAGMTALDIEEFSFDIFPKMR